MTAVRTAPARKLAVVVLSDPKAGGEEALGRVFNALAAAREARDQGEEVAILFVGTGTRWPAELSRPEHPAAELYRSVAGQVAGASCGCAEVFSAVDGAKQAGVALVGDYALPGTSGVASLERLRREGWSVLTF
jgi:hypothetical protein